MCGSPGVSEGRLCAHVCALWPHSTGRWNLLRGDLASACMQCDVSLNVDVSFRYEHTLMRNIITFIFIAFRASVGLSVGFQLLHVSEFVLNSRIELACTSETTVLPPTVTVMKVGV
jgi:hypothetical protein